jgi:anion-transporting  ArsA/GET3 family ATPase
MSNRSAFVVITSPEELALDEALFFKRRIRELGLVAEGFILNRSYASVESTDRPAEIEPELRGKPHADVLREALVKLDDMAAREAARAESDQRLFGVLDEEGKKHQGQGAIALPYLDEAVEDIPALAALSNHILEPRAEA